ncbi:Gfo/Idh/MocA family oxidoreductase [Schaedlerella arabinosiphila]|uniref:Gfo/Idh/MocA family oxidoreductase n=1 Tax=Schaedlerella arabinosiphila TaxID=2044587 RepID=A0A9X5C6U2_9FIRM|nr:Gfo/Idh/MocA family oxidoreductase [Schaedlerella arabinosiphila]KAI4443436.1 hypothetical protein C824_005971 [Schaedlerella arabinosiphila]NDO68836.1 Gfo/Idh/MocA family oxidoreductase [Schaedlerella arabinosiphila]
MRVLFIGLGSIAKRHISNLKEMFGREISITVLRSGNNLVLEDAIIFLIAHICYDSSELEQEYDAVFVTNPTSQHYNTLLKYKRLSNCFFVEKPVFLTGKEELKLFKDDRKVYYVACPIRYTNVIQYIKKNIDFSYVYSMRCISSSYLPDWRTGIDYRQSYSASKALGGGVSIDLIHEWDYIDYLIGEPLDVKYIATKKSDLEIDSDDIAVYIAEYEDKVVEIHLDYFGRVPIRRIELFTHDDTIVVDLINQKIEWLRQKKIIKLFQDRDEYQRRELTHFFDIVKGKCDNDNTLEKACKILQRARGEE